MPPTAGFLSCAGVMLTLCAIASVAPLGARATCAYHQVFGFNPLERWGAITTSLTSEDTDWEGRVWGNDLFAEGSNFHTKVSVYSPAASNTPFSVTAGEGVPSSGPASFAARFNRTINVLNGGVEAVNSIRSDGYLTVEGDVVSTDQLVFAAGSAKVTGKVKSKDAAEFHLFDPNSAPLTEQSNTLSVSVRSEQMIYIGFMAMNLGSLPDRSVHMAFENGVLMVDLFSQANVVNMDAADAKTLWNVVLRGHPLGVLIINVLGEGDITMQFIKVVYEDKAGNQAAPTFGRVAFNFASQGTVRLTDYGIGSRRAHTQAVKTNTTGKHEGCTFASIKDRKPFDMARIIARKEKERHSTKTAPKAKTARNAKAQTDVVVYHASFFAIVGTISVENVGVKGNIGAETIITTDAAIYTQPFGTFPPPSAHPNKGKGGGKKPGTKPGAYKCLFGLL